MKRMSSWTIVLLLSVFAAPLVFGAEDRIIREALAVRVPSSFQRSMLAIDPIELMIAAGTWKTPKPGDSVIFPNADPGKWERITADANGWFSGPAISDGYVCALVISDKDRPAVLNGLGDAYVFVNSEPRMGGQYAVKDICESWEPRFDYGQVPVLLKRGENRLLFRCTRGRLKVVLSTPAAPVLFNEKDITLPDALVGETIEAWGAIAIMNATNRVQKDLVVTAAGEGLEPTTSEVGILQPF